MVATFETAQHYALIAICRFHSFKFVRSVACSDCNFCLLIEVGNENSKKTYLI